MVGFCGASPSEAVSPQTTSSNPSSPRQSRDVAAIRPRHDTALVPPVRRPFPYLVMSPGDDVRSCRSADLSAAADPARSGDVLRAGLLPVHLRLS
jgi:hypothetical protein